MHVPLAIAILLVKSNQVITATMPFAFSISDLLFTYMCFDTKQCNLVPAEKITGMHHMFSGIPVYGLKVYEYYCP